MAHRERPSTVRLTRITDVLVVEDDADTRELFAEILGRAGCTVRQAAGVDRALLEIGRRRPDVVVVDLLLDGGASGHDLAVYVRSEVSAARSGGARVIALA